MVISHTGNSCLVAAAVAPGYFGGPRKALSSVGSVRPAGSSAVLWAAAESAQRSGHRRVVFDPSLPDRSTGAIWMRDGRCS